MSDREGQQTGETQEEELGLEIEAPEPPEVEIDLDQVLPADPATPLTPFQQAAKKVKTFPRKPGVYLMKDSAGIVIYVGKAKSLRSRASSYFGATARNEMRTSVWIDEIADIDYLECESEVDALLTESRLIKDIQPRHNKELKDDKTFPYLQIFTREDFPRVEVTREPLKSGVKLFGPFPSAGSLRGAVQVLQKIFQFRTCSLDINDGEEKWQWFRPCLLASIKQCTAPCNDHNSGYDLPRAA